MKDTHIPDQILALASIMQPLGLIHDLAQKGACDAQSLQASLHSITNTGNSIDVLYSSKDELTVGLNTLKNVLTKSKNHRHILIYFMGLIKIEKLVRKHHDVSAIITHNIEPLQGLSLEEATNNHTVAKYAELYRNIAQLLDQKIIINGKQDYLTNTHLVNHIRALLLAGIRSVNLWRTLGGSMWQLIFNKKRIISRLDTVQI